MKKSFNNIKRYIDQAKKDPKAEIWVGGKCDNKDGWFVQPTIIQAKDPKYVTMCEEIFGPVLTVYIYPANSFEKTLELVDNTSPYALTGAIIARDRQAVELATNKLRNAAGNFYINDKPTGAVVGQQPFGGARASGTNDKAGSILNLYRWLSARTIKETLIRQHIIVILLCRRNKHNLKVSNANIVQTGKIIGTYSIAFKIFI
jgi:1-pyrroline-5-carboxylate dehydrogenase